MNKIAKREQLEKYLTSHNIDVVLLQETKVKHKGTEQIGNYTFFFSSQADTRTRPTISTEKYKFKLSTRAKNFLKVIKKPRMISPGDPTQNTLG